jgi:hypothetical protein
MGILVFVSDLREKTLSFSVLSRLLCMKHSLCWGEFFLFLIHWELFYHIIMVNCACLTGTKPWVWSLVPQKLNFVKCFSSTYGDDRVNYVLRCVHTVYHIYWFMHVKLPWHPSGKFHLIMAYNPFHVLFNLVFFEGFCICVH